MPEAVEMVETRSPRSVSTSRRACVEASWVYLELFRRYDPADADAGLEQAYEAGRRWLIARAEADEWSLSDDIANAVGLLLASVEELPGEDVDEWLERFPRALMTLLERRSRQIDFERPGRRVSDQLARPRPAAVRRDCRSCGPMAAR